VRLACSLRRCAGPARHRGVPRPLPAVPGVVNLEGAASPPRSPAGSEAVGAVGEAGQDEGGRLLGAQGAVVDGMALVVAESANWPHMWRTGSSSVSAGCPGTASSPTRPVARARVTSSGGRSTT